TQRDMKRAVVGIRPCRREGEREAFTRCLVTGRIRARHLGLRRGDRCAVPPVRRVTGSRVVHGPFIAPADDGANRDPHRVGSEPVFGHRDAHGWGPRGWIIAPTGARGAGATAGGREHQHECLTPHAHEPPSGRRLQDVVSRATFCQFPGVTHPATRPPAGTASPATGAARHGRRWRSDTVRPAHSPAPSAARPRARATRRGARHEVTADPPWLGARGRSRGWLPRTGGGPTARSTPPRRANRGPRAGPPARRAAAPAPRTVACRSARWPLPTGRRRAARAPVRSR